MKICLIMGGNEEGGLENHVVDVANALVKKHEVHFIAHTKYESRLKEVHFHPVDLTQSRRNPILLYNVTRLIRNISPEIIHAQANKAVSIIANIKPFLPKGIYSVATLHSQKRNLKAFTRFDRVIGVSTSILEQLEHPYKKVIYNGVKIDQTRLKPREYLLEQLGLETTKLLFVTLARLVSLKRIDVLLAAFQGIEKAHLVIVGDGPEKSSLEKLSADLKLTDISFLGQRDDNIELLSAADLCVISSEREGFCYVMAESLQAGTPVISTDVADMKKILPQQTVVAVNNIRELNQLITTVVSDYAVFCKHYPPVFEWALENLYFNKMMDSIEQLYQELVSK